MADEAYDGARDDAHNGARKGTRRGWGGATKPDDQLTMIGVPAGLSREFDDWFRSQYPDHKQLPSKDPYREKAFRIGLATLKAKFPPVASFEERMAELDGMAS